MFGTGAYYDVLAVFVVGNWGAGDGDDAAGCEDLAGNDEG